MEAGSGFGELNALQPKAEREAVRPYLTQPITKMVSLKAFHPHTPVNFMFAIPCYGVQLMGWSGG